MERIDLVSYLCDLVKAILTSYGLPERVTASVDGPCIELGIDRSTPFALLASEVISNACKHAFPGERTGTLSIVADQIGDQVTVRIADDGIGLPSEAASHHGMGHRLIGSFVQQLDGEYRFEAQGGTAFILSFPHRPPTTH